MEDNLFKIDKQLYDKMRNNYVSEAEREFFERQEWKAQNEYTDWELIIESNENEDGFYLIRYIYTEYELGTTGEPTIEDIHTMTLAEILAVNLKSVGFLNRNITFLDWLREQDYKCVRYDRDKNNL